MSRLEKLESKFVYEMPKHKEAGILYICLRFDIVIHLCPCGCGNESVTPISKGHWTLTCSHTEGVLFATLSPSIANRICKSHYYIKKNKVDWL